MTKLLSLSLRRYKEAYAGHPKEIWILAGVTLVNRMGTMVIPFLSVYLTSQLGFSLRTAGLIASGFGFGSMAGAFIGGKLADRWGAVPVIQASLFLGGLFFIALQWVDQSWALWLMLFLTTTLGESYRPAYSVAVGSLVPKNQTGRTMALLRLAVNLGMSLAPTIGGFVVVSLGYSYLFWIEGLTCIGAALFFAWKSRGWEMKTLKQKKSPKEKKKVLPLRNENYMLFLLSTFFMSFVFLQWFHTVPVFIKKEWVFDERYIGLLMGFSSFLITLIEMPIIDTVEKKKKNVFAMKIGLLAIAGSYLFFFFPKAAILGYLAIFVWTLGEILFLPLNNSMALTMSPDENRGDFMAWYYMSWSLSNILAPTLGFAVISLAGYDFFWGMLLAFGGFAFFFHQKASKES